MDPPEYGYEYWKHYHSDCELVHVMWTDYCGILNEKLVPAENFGRMYRKHVYNLSDFDASIPLTVSAAALTSLPDGKSAAEEIYHSYGICNLIPDYDTIQPCIDSRSRATVFAEVEVGGDYQADPRKILKEVGEIHGLSREEQKISASFEFQFVLRNLSDGNIHLPHGDGPAQNVVQKLAQALRTHGHSATGLSIQSSDISMGGVMTIALSMSDNVLDAVDNYYRVKRALQSIASLENLRPSFFYASEGVSGAAFSGTPFDVMCKNRLHCRLHLALTSWWDSCHFAANMMETEEGAGTNPSIYAFSKPNWLTYGQRLQYRGDPSPGREWMTWGVRNSKTTINFPEGCESRRLEFGEIDCMANMYLVVAAIVATGCSSIGITNFLGNIPQAIDADEYKTSFGSEFSETRRIPLTGLHACQSIWTSVRNNNSPLEDIHQAYLAVRKTEDKSIVQAVAQRRATSARELLEKWY